MKSAGLGMRSRRRAVVAGAVLLATLAGGCGSGTEPAGGPADGVITAREVAEQERPVPAASTSPSLPPGDPGLDAPAAPDPGTAGAEPHEGERARRTVPVAAMLTADTVQMVLGGSWDRHAGDADECLAPQEALGVRTMAYDGASEGALVATVATYPDAGAADAAIAALGRAATGCGWTGVGDPRLGSASVSASVGPRSMVGVSAEGVLVLLVGTGRFTGDAARWGSLVDLALGSSCPAAPDGCH